MRNSLIVAAVLALVATGAVAQSQNPPANNAPQNSAINSSDSSNRQVTAPVAGRNSFTEGEAKSRIEKMGFSNVSNLKKDDNVHLSHALKLADALFRSGRRAEFLPLAGQTHQLTAQPEIRLRYWRKLFEFFNEHL